MTYHYRLFPGYRPTALLLFSTIWFSVGLGLLTRPVQVETTHLLPIEYLPVWVRVGLWWAPAVAGVISAFWSSEDKWGWALLSIPVTFRVTSYAIASVFGWLDPTYALSWTVILGVLALLAFWPEPVKGVSRP